MDPLSQKYQPMDGAYQSALSKFGPEYSQDFEKIPPEMREKLASLID